MTKLGIAIFSFLICIFIIIMAHSFFAVKNEQGKETMQDFMSRSFKVAGKKPDPTKLYCYDKKTNQIFIKSNLIFKEE